jgi:hypothetical protein
MLHKNLKVKRPCSQSFESTLNIDCVNEFLNSRNIKGIEHKSFFVIKFFGIFKKLGFIVDNKAEKDENPWIFLKKSLK